ncbi:MAG: iron-containing alcohol dehydrogenase [Clostridia bacterium]|nr:iron-containing alcohol dehydrogenase [Clostridia bacterium]
MNSFTYEIPTKVYFGQNQLGHLVEELKKFGKKVLLTYGGGSIKKIGLYDTVVKAVKEAGLELYELSGIEPNPRVSSVREGAKICKEEGIDVILAVGGGSVIDCSKFIGAGAKYDGDPWDLSTGDADVIDCLPIVTVLTLSATGSEMNCGGVISNPETCDKIGRMCTPLLPKVSFLDPTLTYTVSPYQTACGSIDIFSHICECYFAPEKDLSMLDGFMEVLLKTVIRYAPVAMKEPDNYEARANLMWASSWALNGFIDGGKTHAWSCHPIEHELSAYYDITHGLGLAIITPRWMKYVLNDKTMPKFVQYGVNVFNIDPAKAPRQIAEEAIRRTEQFFYDTLKVKSTLTEIGIGDENFTIMAKKASRGLANAFVPLKADEVKSILMMCL